MKTILQHWLSRCWLGVGTLLVAAVAAQAQTAVTFQCDMSAYGTPGAVYVNGQFNGWGSPGSPVLVNNGSDVWIGTITISDPPGTVENFKFWNDIYAGNWESIGNRQFVLGDPINGTQVLPVQAFDVNTLPSPTNQVTFQVDMSAQVLLGNFTNDNSNAVGDTNGSITVSGDLIGSGWGDGWPLTNNPSLSGNATNIYSGVIPIVGFPGSTTVNYKFRMSGGWESVANRAASITSSSQVLPLVFYNNNTPYDLLSAPITVTFSIYMPDGTLDDGNNITGLPYPFNPEGGDTLWINGDFLNNWNNSTWPGPISSFPAAQQMIEVGTSGVYTNSFVVPKGNSIVLTYKYSIDSIDDENGFGTNHVREIRSYGPTYAMPQDVWSWSVLQPGNGNPYPNPGIASTNIVEPDFGYLAAGAPSGGNIPITWLGRPAVLLQNTSDLASGIWNTIIATDGTQSINWPNAGGNQFFRLMKKQ
jgi:hypothetical protein